MKESAEILKDWWKPLELSQRQYAWYEKFGNSPMPHGPQMDICVGQIEDDLMGFYFVYHTNWINTQYFVLSFVRQIFYLL